MSIVLNEREWVEEMIAARSLGKKPIETLTRMARYYMDDDIPRKEVRKRLEAFILQCDPSASIPKWDKTLSLAVSGAKKYQAIGIQGVEITKPEMDRINRLKGTQMRRLAFTLLCLAKYWDAVGAAGEHWMNTKDSEVMRMANINTSIRRQSLLYHDLREAGLVSFSKKVDNTNVQVNFMTDGEVVLHVADFRNLGYQYLKYRGEPYFECVNCGIVSKVKDFRYGKAGPKQKYCAACAAADATQRRVNAVMWRKEEEISEE